ncbi:MAG TPA: hypothetical protein VFF77_04390 [Holophagaceae bacterium]|jgi:hypothetical protein|nr:hypothetical protein [Holophagaceae bacterium]
MAGFGSLANLAKILEDASKPDSSVREDRERRKVVLKKGTTTGLRRAVDPKRKAWHERRLKALGAKGSMSADTEKKDAPAPSPVQLASRAATQSVATALSGSLMQTLAAAKDAKPKEKEGGKRAESWKRKPGDPIF